MLFHCVGYTGTYPLVAVLQPCWRPIHTSSSQLSSLLLEQDTLPPIFLRDDDMPALRLTLCGVVWNGSTCYGQSLESLFELQALLDVQWPACLDVLDGDFSLCYFDGETVSLYRSLTCTRELYYRMTQTEVRWSTSPGDLFSNGYPTLGDVDQEMATIVAATGFADPERCVYHQWYRLPAGKRHCFFPDGTCQKYQMEYVIREDNTHLPYRQATKLLREYIELAVARTFGNSSSCHVFISGGLDTAIIAYEMARQGKDVHGYHWTWDLPVFRQEYLRAHSVAQQYGIHFHPINFQNTIESGGGYVTSMMGLPLPYNHAFYTCFRETVAAVARQSSQEISLLATGHLGDTLFQGDWSDPFRPVSSDWLSLLRSCHDIFSWYPRDHAWGVMSHVLGRHRRDWQANVHRERVFAHQLLLTPEAFQRVLRHGMVDYRDLQSDQLKQHSFEARLVAAALQSGIAFNAPLKTAVLYRDAFPQRVVLRHPFADRQLHEFCLSLGPQHRKRWYGGQIFTKFLMRLAYCDVLPPAIIQNEIRTPYAAISEQFCLRNRHQLMDIFSRDAILARWGILNASQVEAILATAETCQQHSRSLVRMAGVEMWLQGLTQHARLPSQSSTPSVSVQTGPYQSQHERGVAHLHDTVRVHLIHGRCLLINIRTLQVSRLNEVGTDYLLALLEEVSWTNVVGRIMLPQESFLEVEQRLSTFAETLQDAQWIMYKQRGDEV